MATEMKSVADMNGNVGVTQFYGGVKNGKCVQITPANTYHPYVQLTRDQALALASALVAWANEIYPEKVEANG